MNVYVTGATGTQLQALKSAAPEHEYVVPTEQDQSKGLPERMGKIMASEVIVGFYPGEPETVLDLGVGVGMDGASPFFKRAVVIVTGVGTLPHPNVEWAADEVFETVERAAEYLAGLPTECGSEFMVPLVEKRGKKFGWTVDITTATDPLQAIGLAAGLVAPDTHRIQ